MITTAIQQYNNVYVYGENNKLLFIKSGELYGFTSTTVSIKNGNMVMVCNEKGNVLSIHSVF